MERRTSDSGPGWAWSLRRLVARGCLGLALLGGALWPQELTASGDGPGRHSRDYFRREMPRSVRADHPAIVPVAIAIRAVTRDPLEQIVMVNDITHLLVDYDDDQRVYGTTEYHATLDEMLARRRQAGWLYLRDDCDGRAIFAAHLLAALGIEWRLEASFWKQHAWIVAKVNGASYDLLDLRTNAPETDNLSYKLVGRHFVRASHRPPTFSWRKAWAERTNRDLQIGLALGLLNVESTTERMQQRYATDWTRKSPGEAGSPADERTLASAIAGFPYGEPRFVGALASAEVPAEEVASGLSLGVSTGSASSAPADAGK
jgi:hypothetical protein